MTNVIYVATSLDGYIARKNGSIDWLMDIPNPESNDFGYAAFMHTIDAIVMGKHTFEVVSSFDEWPYQKPVFVLSTTLKTIPDRLVGQVEMLQGDPRWVLQTLHNRHYRRLLIDGGQTIQSFLKLDLIDEMTITQVPILLGDGISLFSVLTQEQRFEWIESEILLNTLVKSHYKKIANSCQQSIRLSAAS